MAPRSPQPPGSPDSSDRLRGVASLVFHELRSAVQPPPAVALLDRVDRDHTAADAALELLVSQGILCCRQIHRIGCTPGPPDEELAFLNLSMLDLVLDRIAELATDTQARDRLESPHGTVQDLMLRIGKDFGPFDEDG